MKAIAKYSCGYCEEQYYYEDDAAYCCNSPDKVYVCSECGQTYGEEEFDDAENCCMEEEDGEVSGRQV